MPTLQVSLPSQLWERLELYRRMRGKKRGLPVVDVQIAIVKLLERGLSETENPADSAKSQSEFSGAADFCIEAVSVGNELLRPICPDRDPGE